MWKRIALILILAFGFSLVNSGIADASTLKNFVDTADGYEFSYPTGWLQVKVNSGPDVVFHDLIEISENVSVVISPVAQGRTLAKMGTPTEVGYRLGKVALAPPNSGRSAELINAVQKEYKGKIYYILEYLVKLPNQEQRHNITSVAISRGKLFTFNASVPERRWTRINRMIDESINSFQVY